MYKKKKRKHNLITQYALLKKLSIRYDQTRRQEEAM